MKKRPTISDVAKLAGVTKGTVSRVLRGGYPASEKTREAVEKAVQELGYVASYRAQALATGRTNAIGIIITESFDHLFDDPTFFTILKGIFEKISETRFVPLLLQASSHGEQERAIDVLLNQAVDGVIHLTPWADEVILDVLLKKTLPVVICGQVSNQDFLERYSCVYSDDVIGGATAARHLRDVGVRNPVAIMGEKAEPASIDRLRGYKDVYPELNNHTRVEFGGWTQEDGAHGMRVIMKRRIEFDGVLAASDRIARGVLSVLAEQGIQVPQDIKVIGYDDNKMAWKFAPKLSTVSQPMVRQGATAVRLLEEMLNGGKPRVVVLPTELKIRDTTLNQKN